MQSQAAKKKGDSRDTSAKDNIGAFAPGFVLDEHLQDNNENKKASKKKKMMELVDSEEDEDDNGSVEIVDESDGLAEDIDGIEDEVDDKPFLFDEEALGDYYPPRFKYTKYNDDESSEESEEEEDESNLNNSKYKSNETDEDEDSDDIGDIFAFETPQATEQISQQFKMNAGEMLTIYCSKFMRGPDKYYAVIFVDDLAPCWYYICDQFKVPLVTLFKNNHFSVPPVIDNLSEHKLRVKHSPRNEKVFRPNSRYATTRWGTIVPLNPVNPEQHLNNHLNRFTKYFKQALTPKSHITPGRRFLTFCENSGKTSVLNACSYMGDIAGIEKQTNDEFIKLGKKEHVYVKGVHLDAFWTDFSIKTFLEKFLNCSSWDDVTEEVKMVCYKNYPNRPLPDWDTITN